MRLTHRQLAVNSIFCTALLAVVIWALFNEYNRPWKYFQKEFGRLEHGSGEKLLYKSGSEGIEQIWLQDLGHTDRCTTCHLGINNPEFKDQSQPFKTHSGDHLKYHPIEKFGCVVCHDGQGPGLTVRSAHGEVEEWNRPLLRSTFVQSSCGRCHFMDQKLPLYAEMPMAGKFTEGWRLFNEYSCTGCHSLSEYKRPERVGPSLDHIGNKVKQEWLIKWLKDPKSLQPDTKMPRFILSDEEIRQIASYMLTLESPVFSTDEKKENLKAQELLDKENIKHGKELVISLGCSGCHKTGQKGSGFAPDFTGLGSKLRPEWLYEFLKKPEAYDPDTIIPDFRLSEDDVLSLTSFLMSLKNDSVVTGTEHVSADTYQHSDAEKGKKLVSGLGCRGCHNIKSIRFRYNTPDLDGIGSKRTDELFFGSIAGTDRKLINWMKTKVMHPEKFTSEKIKARMPNYDFNEEQADSLVIFLSGIKEEPVPAKYFKMLADPERVEMRGRKIIEKYNCLGCHRINKEGGEIGPELTFEAKKSRQEWLYGFLKKPFKIRPVRILKAEMPDFKLSDMEVNSIIEYLAFISQETYPYGLEPKTAIDPDDIRAGEKLYHEIFACTGCHKVEKEGGEIGPDHTDLASRLKREWIEQWLKDPQKIKPDVRMPRFELEDWQFRSLTDYLMTLGKYRFAYFEEN